jgi:hypothetical protein
LQYQEVKHLTISCVENWRLAMCVADRFEKRGLHVRMKSIKYLLYGFQDHTLCARS